MTYTETVSLRGLKPRLFLHVTKLVNNLNSTPGFRLRDHASVDRTGAPLRLSVVHVGRPTCVCERQIHSGMQLTTRMLQTMRRVASRATSSGRQPCSCMVSHPASATRVHPVSDRALLPSGGANGNDN
jgi:hypothetical protein